jgi:hypothetical protein
MLKLGMSHLRSLEILCSNNGDLEVKGWMFLKGLRTILTSSFLGYRLYIYLHIYTVLPLNMTRLGNEKKVVLSRCHIFNNMTNWTWLSQ